MALGYDGKLYILAFDHRGSFQKKMFGIEGDPTEEETERIADAKHLIFEGLLQASEQGAEPEVTGCLVDEQFGAPEADPAGGQGARADPRDAGGEVRPGRVRLRLRRGVRRAHRELRPGPVEGPREVQPGGRRGHERAPDGAPRAPLRLAPRARPEVPLRAARAGRARTARAGGRGHRPLRRRAAPGADAANDRDAPGRRRGGGHLEDRGHRHPGGLRAHRRRPPDAEGRDGVVCVVLGRGANDEKVEHWLRQGAPVDGLRRLRDRPHHLVGRPQGVPRRRPRARATRRSRSPTSTCASCACTTRRRGAAALPRSSLPGDADAAVPRAVRARLPARRPRSRSYAASGCGRRPLSVRACAAWSAAARPASCASCCSR